MKKYIWLFNRPDKKRAEAQVLELNETLSARSLVVREQTQRRDKTSRYMVFETIEEYRLAYHLNAAEHLNHEVILEWQPQKLKFDLDSGDTDKLEEIKMYIEMVFTDIYPNNNPPIICDCSSSSATKFSHHLIITNCCLENGKECKHFYEQLKKQLKEDSQEDLIACIDWSVNKKTQNLRLAYSTKEGRKKRIPTGFTFEDTLVTNTKGLPMLPKLADYSYKNSEFADAGIPLDAMATIDPTIWATGSKKGNMLSFLRLKASHCDICNREHTSIGMYIFVANDKVLRGCYHGTEYRTIWTTPFCGEGGFSEPVDDTAQIASPCKHVEPLQTNYFQVVKYYSGHHSELNKKEFTRVLVRDLLKVMRVTVRGNSSIVVLKLGNDYEIQKWNTFMPTLNNMRCWAAKENKNEKVKPMDIKNIVLDNMKLFGAADVVFDPSRKNSEDKINIFNGFAASFLPPDNTNITPIINHIEQIWAGGNLVASTYILDWMANIIQGRKNETALVLYSAPGAGKNIITGLLCDIIGELYATPARDIESLTGKFNNLYANQMLVVIDEASNIEGGIANYHKTFDQMKNLITNHTIVLEKKGVDAVKMKDFTSYIITTNNRVSVKVEEGDRRYSMFHLPDTVKDNTEYFDKLNNCIEKSKHSFYQFLLTRKITCNMRRPYVTQYKTDIIMRDSATEYARSVPQTEVKMAQYELYADYEEWCGQNNKKPTSIEKACGIWLELKYIIRVAKSRDLKYQRKLNNRHVYVNGVLFGPFAKKEAEEVPEEPDRADNIDNDPINLLEGI